MNDTPKSFVLIPGAWMGDWAWHEVIQKLKAQCHRAYSLTLSGVAENADTANISLQTHVDDVVALIHKNDLQNVVIVGHSYSGLVAGLVADQTPERIKHIVFVKAFIPHHGRSLVDAFGEEQAKSDRKEIADHDGKWPPPIAENIKSDPSLSDEQKHYLTERMVPHPGQTVTQPVEFKRHLSELNATYIDCNMDGHPSSEMKAMCNELNWDYHVLQSGHWPMITVPDALVKRLVSVY